MKPAITGPQRELRANEIVTLVKFDDRGPVPLAIKIDGVRCDIERVTYRWVSHRGAYAIYHYSSMLASGEMVEMTFDSCTMSWHINRLAEM